MDKAPRLAAEEALARVKDARRRAETCSKRVIELKELLYKAIQEERDAMDQEESLKMELDIICSAPPAEGLFMALPADIIYMISRVLNLRDRRSLANANRRLGIVIGRPSKEEYRMWIRQAKHVSFYPGLTHRFFDSELPDGIIRLEEMSLPGRQVTAAGDGVVAYKPSYASWSVIECDELKVEIPGVHVMTVKKHPVFPELIFANSKNYLWVWDTSTQDGKTNLHHYNMSPTGPIIQHGNTLVICDYERENTLVF